VFLFDTATRVFLPTQVVIKWRNSDNTFVMSFGAFSLDSDHVECMSADEELDSDDEEWRVRPRACPPASRLTHPRACPPAPRLTHPRACPCAQPLRTTEMKVAPPTFVEMWRGGDQFAQRKLDMWLSAVSARSPRTPADSVWP
jgi:hypothetical protein